MSKFKVRWCLTFAERSEGVRAAGALLSRLAFSGATAANFNVDSRYGEMLSRCNSVSDSTILLCNTGHEDSSLCKLRKASTNKLTVPVPGLKSFILSKAPYC
jgi:hypothetical protein